MEVGQLYCDFSAEEFVDQMLARNIANLADLVAAGLPAQVLTVLDAHMQLVASKGEPFPGPVKQALRDLVAPYYDTGRTGYSYEDIDDVAIISDSDSDAALYLSAGADAITLGRVIVLKEEDYRWLQSGFSLDAIQKGYASPAYAQAIETAAHELVHVSQFRHYGSDVFLTNYLLDWLARGAGDEGYERSKYEDEAYAFSARLSLASGGWYCEDNRKRHEDKIRQRHLNLTYGACTPLYYGNQPAGVCALPVSWEDGTTKQPSLVDGECRVAQPPPSSTPVVSRPGYYIEAESRQVNCRKVRTGPASEPMFETRCDTAYSCAVGRLAGDMCCLGAAPDGTRAGYDSNHNFFTYLEISLRPVPTPRPTSSPAAECPSGYRCCDPPHCQQCVKPPRLCP